MVGLKKIFIGGLFCLLTLMTSLSIFTIYQSQLSVYEKIETLLKVAIVLDSEHRIKETRTIYSSGYNTPPNNSIISIKSEKNIAKINKEKDLEKQEDTEKELRVKQTYLLSICKTPINIETLNSLFKSSLKKNGLNLNTALAYTANGCTEYSCKDSTFYTGWTTLSPIMTGMDNEILIQGYVDIPFKYIVNKEKGYLTILAILFISIFIFLVATKRSKKVEKVIFEPILETERTRTQIKENLLFDKEKGVLYFNGNIQVTLENYKLKIFILLLDSPEHFQTSKDINRIVWEEVVVTSGALTTTIKRLRTKLEPIPDLHIIFENGGYRLDIL